MVLVDSDKFSASDLILFIESLEEISRIESLRQQRKQKNRRARSNQEADTQSTSAIITSSDGPAEAIVMENFEEYNIDCNSTCMMDNQYYLVNHNDDTNKENDNSWSCHTELYSAPYDCTASTKLDDSDYEPLNLSLHQYEELPQELKRTKAKRKLSFLGMVCKKYKKCFSNKTDNEGNWCKSDSWTNINFV